MMQRLQQILPYKSWLVWLQAIDELHRQSKENQRCILVCCDFYISKQDLFPDSRIAKRQRLDLKSWQKITKSQNNVYYRENY